MARGAWCAALAVLALAAGCSDDPARIIEQALGEQEPSGGSGTVDVDGSVAAAGSSAVAEGGSSAVAEGGSSAIAEGGSGAVAAGGSDTEAGGSSAVAAGGSGAAAGSGAVAEGGSGDVSAAGSGAGGSGAVAEGGSDAGPVPDAPPAVQAQTLAEGELSALALGAGTLYVVDEAARVIARRATDGGTLEPITPALDLLPSRLVADESSVYAALFQRPGRTEVWSLPADGGAFDAALGGVLLGEVPSVAALAVNDGSVAVLEARPTPSSVTRGIFSLDKVAGGVVPVGTVNLLFSDAFALDDQAAFVVRGGDGVSDVVGVDLASGDLSSLADANSNESLRQLAVESGVVYFASTTRVGRIPASDQVADAGTLSATPAYRLVVAADHVYFFQASGTGCAGGSELYRVAVTGGTAEHFASEPAPGCITDLVANADGVYWLTADGSQLRAVSLP